MRVTAQFKIFLFSFLPAKNVAILTSAFLGGKREERNILN
jgi:hypothetical protein